jgi:hypothetical protein
VEKKQLKLLLTIIFSLIFLISLVGGVYYWRVIKTTTTSKPEERGDFYIQEPKEYYVKQQTEVYDSPDGVMVHTLVKGNRFIILDRQEDWLQIKITRSEEDISDEGWIRTSEGAYFLIFYDATQR